VADAGAHRTREARERPDECLVVERSEILGRAAAARENDHVEIADLREPIERGDERFDRADALDLRGREDELHARVPAGDDLLDVMPDRADRAGDDTDPPRRRRQRALSLDGE